MARSTCEAEYIAASEAANEGFWMKGFISDLGVIPSASFDRRYPNTSFNLVTGKSLYSYHNA